MKVELVMRIRDNAGYLGRTLSRDDLTFAVVPCVGDGVIWNGEWGVETCIYRYVGIDYVEIGLSPCAAQDVDELVAAGWTLR
jgi:hypothetical protein